MKVKLSPTQKIKVIGSRDVYKIMQEVLLRERKVDRNKEFFWVICLAENHRLLLLELVSFGAPTTAEPTDVFSFALQKKVAKVIMVHSHRNETTVANSRDKALTDRMAAVGKFVNIPVMDHLIITEHDYFSFADTGLLQKIVNETHYDLTFANIDKVLAETDKKVTEITRKLVLAEAEVEQAKKAGENKLAKKTQEFAKKLLKKGLSVSEIVSLTGLSKVEVERLKK